MYKISININDEYKNNLKNMKHGLKTIFFNNILDSLFIDQSGNKKNNKEIQKIILDIITGVSYTQQTIQQTTQYQIKEQHNIITKNDNIIDETKYDINDKTEKQHNVVDEAKHKKSIKDLMDSFK